MKSKVTIATCDRCKQTEQFNLPTQQYHWGKIYVEQYNGTRNIYNKPAGSVSGGKAPIPYDWFDPLAKDLCPTCMKEVDDWYHQRPVKDS